MAIFASFLACRTGHPMDPALVLLTHDRPFGHGAMIPGPGFLPVVRISLVVSRPAGLAASLSMGAVVKACVIMSLLLWEST